MLFQKLPAAFMIMLLTTSLAHADLVDYLNSLNVSADADFGDFRTGLGAHFGASGVELDHVFLSVYHPADAALCFWLARASRQPMDVVLRQYKSTGKKSWGALAQSLGIKPGSAEFKALKAGQIGWEPPGGHGKADERHGADANKTFQGHGSKGNEGNGKKS